MEVRVLPLPIHPLNIRDDVCIVVDVIRATTTAISLFESGCHLVYLSKSRSDPRALGQAVGSGALLTAEADDGTTAPGFDCEPSPALIAGMDLTDRIAVLATANGTPTASVVHNSGAYTVILGALRNLTAVALCAASIAKSTSRPLTIICAGRQRNTRIALEDLYCAGALVEALLHAPKADVGVVDLDDSARVALGVAYAHVDPHTVLAASRSGQHLIERGQDCDLVYAAARDATAIVPMLVTDGGTATWPVQILDLGDARTGSPIVAGTPRASTGKFG